MPASFHFPPPPLTSCRAMAPTLPPELVRAVFSVAAPPKEGEDDIDSAWNPRTVLNFEERARAEVGCSWGFTVCPGCAMAALSMGAVRLPAMPAAPAGAKGHGGASPCHAMPVEASPHGHASRACALPCRPAALPPVQLVCKQWRAALTEEPGALTSLSISPPLPGAGWSPASPIKGAAAAAVSKAAARARALAARAPTVTDVHLQVGRRAGMGPALLPCCCSGGCPCHDIV